MRGSMDVVDADRLQRSEVTMVWVARKSVFKERNDKPYSSSGSYNSVPVVLHCNCFVLDRVY
jgi:hypothetical protein